jgi:hypothetical protein
MFCAKLVLYNVHIDALIEQPYNRNIFLFNHITLQEILCSYAAKHFEKPKQLI